MSPDSQRHHPLALIVDDDTMMRLVLREALEVSGLDVEEAENGTEGLLTAGFHGPAGSLGTACF